MKKIVFVLVALVVAAPAFGVAVDINAIQVGSTADVNITYIASGGKLPRAFALNIWVDNDANIVGISNYFRGESSSGSKGYGVFPASFDRHINPADPNWGDVNYTPVAEPNDLPGDTLGGLDTNGITIEMGSLYAGPNEGPNSPATSGTLCRITVSGGCTVSLSANVGRGKIVFEDSTEAPFNLTGVTVTLTTTVPNVLDMNETAATAAIIAADLVVGDPVIYECNDAELADEVLDQDPNGGATVNTGTDVDLWVSTGKPTVPNVLDMNEADAIAAIDAVTYISAGTPTYECNDFEAAGEVLSQSPGAGVALCSTIVDLVISTGPCVYTISGNITTGAAPIKDLAGVTILGLPGNPVTDANGDYSATVSGAGGWSGTAEPNKVQWTFASPNTVYTNVLADALSEDYTANATECLDSNDPDYAKWVDYSEPNCWCYRKQCRGDADGKQTFFKPVMASDLTIFKAAVNQSKAVVKTIVVGGEPGICADFDHGDTFFKPVMASDLTIFKTYVNVANASVPECPPDNINFWMTPP